MDNLQYNPTNITHIKYIIYRSARTHIDMCAYLSADSSYKKPLRTHAKRFQFTSIALNNFPISLKFYRILFKSFRQIDKISKPKTHTKWFRNTLNFQENWTNCQNISIFCLLQTNKKKKIMFFNTIANDRTNVWEFSHLIHLIHSSFLDFHHARAGFVLQFHPNDFHIIQSGPLRLFLSINNSSWFHLFCVVWTTRNYFCNVE